MAQVELFKRKGTYTDQRTGEEKPFTSFFVKCGDELVPIQVRFYEDEEGKDPRYSARKTVLSAFSAMLPDQEEQAKGKKNASGKVMDDDGDNPFNG